jgi:hypothetical protein
MAYGSGAALAMPIVGHFWYKMSIDPKFAKLTQEQFVKNEKIISDMTCPMQLGFSPDKYYAIMKDSTLKDSMIRSGFRGLRDLVSEMFPEEAAEDIEPSDGEAGGVIDDNESIPENKKQEEKPKAVDPNAQEKKKQEEKSKDPPKKGNR